MPYPIETTAQLIACDLEPDMENSIWFASASARDSFFQSKVIRTETNIQYIRESQNWRINASYDEIIGSCNYLRYRNKTDGRWFYGFVTNIQYLNQNVCTCNFTLDAWMTYQFDLTWKDCFIERECVSIDNIGQHTLDEDVSAGEMMEAYAPTPFPFVNAATGNIELWPCLLLTEVVAPQYTPGPYGLNKSINGMPGTLSVWAPAVTGEYVIPAQDALNNFLSFLASEGKFEAVIMAAAIPKFVFQLPEVKQSPIQAPIGTNSGAYYDFSDEGLLRDSTTLQIDISQPNLVNPNNNKILCYPYNYFILTNNQGDMIDILPEYMYKDATQPENVKQLTLEYAVDISGSPSFMIYPTDYSAGTKTTHKSTIYKLPVLGISGDYFANWLGGHAASLAAQAGGSLLGGTSYASSRQSAGANIADGLTSTVSNLLAVGASVIDKMKVPATLKTTPGNSSNVAAGSLSFNLIHVFLKAERAAVIDNYFSMFGYRVNRMGVPEFRTRQYWNYYKIPVCNVHADIPGESMDQIKTMFNRGVTLWADGNSIGNYHGGSNPIL